MTFSLTIGGTNVAGKMLLPEGLGELTNAADGEPNECLIIVDDPNGEMTFKQLAAVIAEESACTSAPRLYTGIVTKAVQSRGNYRDGPGRIWSLTIRDLNERLHRRILRGASAKRPAETGTERLDWLLTTTGMVGLVADNGQIMANAWAYDEADYRGQYADDVLASIISASAANRWTASVYWDQVAEEASLFYGDVTTTTYDSTLALTNILAEKDDTTIFAVDTQAADETDGEGIYDGVYIDWEGGPTYLQRDSTFTEFGIHRDGTLESTRINNATTALRHANTFLDLHSGAADTVTCTVQLPRDKVNLIDAQMRIAVYFSHLDGYDDPGYTYTRVSRRIVRFSNADNKLYDVTLELSTRGISQSGGGDPGDFPHPPAPTAVVQTGCGFSLGAVVSVVFPNPVSEGHMLVAWLVSRGGSTAISPPAGWTTIQAVQIGGGSTGGSPDSPAAMYCKLADSGDDGQTSFSFQSNNGSSRPKILGWELSGVGAPTAHVSVTNGSGTSFSLPSLSVGTGIVIVGAGLGSDSPAGSTITPFDHFYTEGGDGFWQTAIGADDAVTGGSIAYAVTFGVSGGSSDHDGVAAFFPSDATSNPPTPGQWVYGETVTVTGTTGTTTFPYSAGSLVVYVDGVKISKASYVETDPAAGTFDLSWTKDADEVVRVDYQGI